MLRRIGLSPRSLLRSSFWIALLLAQVVGCARIYRPITVAPAPIHAAPGEVSPSIESQPWGDNSRYMEHAREAGVRMLVLTVANGKDRAVKVSLDPRFMQGEWITPDKAHSLIKQSNWGYALLPVGSLAILPPGQTGTLSGMANLASGISFGITLTIALFNAGVASNSNRKLEAFFREQAWIDGEIPSGGNRQGLLWFRPFLPLRAPAILRLEVADARGSQTLAVLLPTPLAP